MHCLESGVHDWPTGFTEEGKQPILPKKCFGSPVTVNRMSTNKPLLEIQEFKDLLAQNEKNPDHRGGKTKALSAINKLLKPNGFLIVFKWRGFFWVVEQRVMGPSSFYFFGTLMVL